MSVEGLPEVLEPPVRAARPAAHRHEDPDPRGGILTVGAAARSTLTGRREAPGYYLLVVSISSTSTSTSALLAAVHGIL